MNNIEIIKEGLFNFLIRDKRDRYIGFITEKKISQYFEDLSHKIENYLSNTYKCKRSDIDYRGKWIITGKNSIEESISSIDDIITDCENDFGGFFIFNEDSSIGIYVSESPSNIIYMKK